MLGTFFFQDVPGQMVGLPHSMMKSRNVLFNEETFAGECRCVFSYGSRVFLCDSKCTWEDLVGVRVHGSSTNCKAVLCAS